MKIKEVANLFFNYVQYEKSNPVTEQTYFKYHQRINRLVEIWIDKDVESITLNDILLFKTELIKKGCKISYIRTFLILIKTFFKYSSERLKLKVINYEDIELPKQTFTSVNFSTAQELQKFISAIRTDTIYGVRFMAIVTTLMDTGMRLGCEVLKLKRTDINWEGKFVDIEGKGKKTRRVYFRSFSLRWIKKYLSLRKDDHPSLFVIHCKLPYVPKSARIDEVQRYFRSISKLTGIKVNAHKIRRSFATRLKFNKCGIKDISLLLGHSKVDTTERHYLGIDHLQLEQSYKEHMNWGFEQAFQPTDMAWAKHDGWKGCKSCGETEKPHAALGLCHKCYMMEKRAKKLRIAN